MIDNCIIKCISITLLFLPFYHDNEMCVFLSLPSSKHTASHLQPAATVGAVTWGEKHTLKDARKVFGQMLSIKINEQRFVVVYNADYANILEEKCKLSKVKLIL